MKNVGKMFVGLLFVLFVFGCATVTPSQKIESNNNSNCPPPGTEVSFSKVMNSGFARNYAGCDIVVRGDFLSSNAQNFTSWTKEGYTTFQTVDRGSKGAENPLGGGFMGFITAIPNEKADLIFSLKPGDHIVMRGGTFIREYARNYFEVIFMATSIERDK